MIRKLDRCDICQGRRYGVLDGGLFQCENCNPNLMAFCLEETARRSEEARRLTFEAQLQREEDELPPEA